MPWFPLAPVLTLIALVGVVIVNWQDSAQGRPGLIATAVQMAASALYYWFVLRRRKNGWIVTEP
jgi:L-asparagine transporter-like permease